MISCVQKTTAYHLCIAIENETQIQVLIILNRNSSPYKRSINKCFLFFSYQNILFRLIALYLFIEHKQALELLYPICIYLVANVGLT